MAEILKPSNLSDTWASGGDILDPGTSKYLQGWEVEIPPRQWFNYLDNRQDEAIAHINQHGVAVWDNDTEYQALKSYVQGSDGTVYRAINTTTNVDPVSDGGVNWQPLFLTRVATELEAQGWVSNIVALSPLRLSDAFKGANQSLGTNGFQKIPGGFILQWGSASVTSGGTITFPTTFPNSVHSIVAVHGNGAVGVVSNSIGSANVSSFILLHDGGGSLGFRYIAVGN